MMKGFEIRRPLEASMPAESSTRRMTNGLHDDRLRSGIAWEG